MDAGEESAFGFACFVALSSPAPHSDYFQMA